MCVERAGDCGDKGHGRGIRLWRYHSWEKTGGWRMGGGRGACLGSGAQLQQRLMVGVCLPAAGGGSAASSGNLPARAAARTSTCTCSLQQQPPAAAGETNMRRSAHIQRAVLPCIMFTGHSTTVLVVRALPRSLPPSRIIQSTPLSFQLVSYTRLRANRACTWRSERQGQGPPRLHGSPPRHARPCIWQQQPLHSQRRQPSRRGGPP